MELPKKLNPFITIFISAHGEDLTGDVLNEDKLYNLGCSGSVLKQFYKLPLSGITGNIVNNSDILDALYFNSARRLAHNREMNPVEKLHEIREEVLRYRNILRETEELNMTQRDFVARHTMRSQLQRIPSVPDWFPEPSRIRYNRGYSFQANPFVLEKKEKLMDVFERKLGIWVVDASISIALELGLCPGTSATNRPVSLMEMLGILPTTARTQRARDTSGASETTLFYIMQKLLQRFGDKTCINVIDMACRYHDWGRIPQNPDHTPRSFRDEAHSPRYHDTKTKYVDDILDVTESGQQIVEWVDDTIFKLEDGTFCKLALPKLVATPVHYSPIFQVQVGGHSFEIDLDTFKLNSDTDVIMSNGIKQAKFISQIDNIFYIQRHPFVLFVHIRIVPDQPLITRYIQFTGIDSHKKRVWTLYQDMSFPFETPYGTDPTYERRRLPNTGGGGKKNTTKRTNRSKNPKKHTKTQLRKLIASKKIKKTIRNKSK